MRAAEPRFNSVFAIGLVTAGLLALTVVAASTGAPAVAATVAAILSVGVVARMWARRGAARISATLDPGRSVLFRGESLDVGIEVVSTFLLPAWVEVDVILEPVGGSRAAGGGDGDRGGGERSADDDHRRYLLFLPKRGNHRFAVDFPATRRGVYEISIRDIRAGDPMGMLRLPVSGSGRETVYVFPRIGLPAHPSLPSTAPLGNHRAAGAVDDPVYWIGTREYHGRGPARHIHWPATARRGVVQTRIFEPSADRTVVLVVEVAGFLEAAGFTDDSEHFEQMLEAVAATAVELAREGCAMHLVSDGARAGRGTEVRGDDPLQGILTELARLTPRSDHDIREALGRMGRDDVCIYFARRPDRLLAEMTVPGGELARTPVTVVTPEEILHG
ncbi:MAG: DUF58 domain-containing protein [Spirochaetia bacterium]